MVDDVRDLNDSNDSRHLAEDENSSPTNHGSLQRPHLHSPGRRYPRRRLLPIVLFFLTCGSLFFAGGAHWNPGECLDSMWRLGSLDPLRRLVIYHWDDGLVYMACLIGILLTHEMGHFLTSLLYRIPASWPYFIPVPIAPFGTMGAVIGMDGMRADRKEMFDIGLAGPLAGLVVAIPVMWVGMQRLSPEPTDSLSARKVELMNKSTAGARFARTTSLFQLDMPLAVRWAFNLSKNPAHRSKTEVGDWELNPYFMAGWVGLFITGMNMVPVSQLDGGHVAYTLLGTRAHHVARAFLIFVIAYIVYSQKYELSLMVALVMMIGPDHPPTRDDSMPLGWFRTLLGWVSLSIPFLCLPPRLILTSPGY